MKLIISEPNSGKSRIMQLLAFLVEKDEESKYTGNGWSNPINTDVESKGENNA